MEIQTVISCSEDERQYQDVISRTKEDTEGSDFLRLDSGFPAWVITAW